MTKEELKKAFLDDLLALLAKWDATLELVDDDSRDWYSTKKAEFSIPAVYDSENSVEVRPYTTIDVGGYFHKDSK